MLAPRPTPKLEDHPSSAVRGCLFNLFTATLHIPCSHTVAKPCRNAPSPEFHYRFRKTTCTTSQCTCADELADSQQKPQFRTLAAASGGVTLERQGPITCTTYSGMCNIRTNTGELKSTFNPLPVQLKTLLHGLKGCVFSAGI